MIIDNRTSDTSAGKRVDLGEENGASPLAITILASSATATTSSRNAILTSDAVTAIQSFADVHGAREFQGDYALQCRTGLQPGGSIIPRCVGIQKRKNVSAAVAHRKVLQISVLILRETTRALELSAFVRVLEAPNCNSSSKRETFDVKHRNTKGKKEQGGTGMRSSRP